MADWYSNKIPQLIKLNSIGSSELGYITVAAYQKDVPFEIKRVYWTYYIPHNVERGHHAHQLLEQVIIAVSGSIDFQIEAQNGDVYEFKLDHPEKALFIPKLCWRKIKFSHNAVLVCLASLDYDPDEYIRDYEAFKNA